MSGNKKRQKKKTEIKSVTELNEQIKDIETTLKECIELADTDSQTFTSALIKAGIQYKNDIKFESDLEKILNVGLNKAYGQAFAMKAELDYAIKHATRKLRSIKTQQKADVIVENTNAGHAKVVEIKNISINSFQEVNTQLTKALKQINKNLNTNKSYNILVAHIFISDTTNTWPSPKLEFYSSANEFEKTAKQVIISIPLPAELKTWLKPSRSQSGIKLPEKNAKHRVLFKESTSKVIKQLKIKIEFGQQDQGKEIVNNGKKAVFANKIVFIYYQNGANIKNWAETYCTEVTIPSLKKLHD
jgi:hypothetical protein